MKFRIYFTVTSIVDSETYLDEEYWIDLEHETLFEAKRHAFAEFVRTFMVLAEKVPVLQKIILDRIENKETEAVTRIALTEEF